MKGQKFIICGVGRVAAWSANNASGSTFAGDLWRQSMLRCGHTWWHYGRPALNHELELCVTVVRVGFRCGKPWHRQLFVMDDAKAGRPRHLSGSTFAGDLWRQGMLRCGHTWWHYGTCRDYAPTDSVTFLLISLAKLSSQSNNNTITILLWCSVTIQFQWRSGVSFRPT